MPLDLESAVLFTEYVVYTENPARDVGLLCKTVLFNQLAKFAPTLYVNLTRQTGRRKRKEEASQVAEYFHHCVGDYRKQLELDEDAFTKYLQGKTVLEYGPGNILGVALVLYAYGAATVHCVDRFPLSQLSEKNIAIYQHLLNALDQEQRERADTAFREKGNPRSGFHPRAITYSVTPNGLSGAREEYDFIISRAVLEHVNSLEDTMRDMQRSLKTGGLSLHKVDLKSHGLDRYTDFDFLTWPEPLYQLMYSHKGSPNRWRVNTYRELAENLHLRVRKLTPTGQLDQEKLTVIYPKLAKEFKSISREELSWLGFWIHLERA